MLSGAAHPHGHVLAVIAPIISVVVIYLVRIGELNKKRQTIPGRVQENWTLRLFVFAGTALSLGGILEFVVRHDYLRWPTFIAGWICGIGSFVLRRRAISALGKFWSLHVEIRPGHEFVREGPFRRIRHPTYLSMILELLAVGLILNAWLSLLIAMCVFLPTLIYRIRIEEAALVQKFGDAYRRYQDTTPLIIPKLRESDCGKVGKWESGKASSESSHPSGAARATTNFPAKQ